MPKKSKKKYSFPILKRKEIVSCMKELGISVTESDLRSPQPEKFKLIYADILSKLMGINVQNKIAYNKLSLFEHPSLHESSIISVRLFRELIKFMQKVRVSNFSISDLMSPEPCRTIRNLSAIINFARWRVQKYEIYLSQRVKINALNKQLNQTTSENGKLANEFVRLRTKKEQEKPQIEILKTELQNLHKQMDISHKSMENKADIVHTIKKQIKNLKATDGEKKAILNKNKDFVYSLEKKIVRSPERIKKELKIVSNKIEKDKMEINNKKMKLNYDKNKLNNLKILNEVINKIMNEMNGINILKNERCYKLEQEIKKLQNEKIGKEKELKSMVKSHKLININLTQKKNEYSILFENHNKQKHEISKKNKQINNLKKEHSKKRISKQTQISDLDKQIAMKREAINNLIKENKYYINQLNAKYKLLMEHVNNYQKQMTNAMQTWSN